MAVNIELMRKKLARLKGEIKDDNKKTSVFFSPEEGETDIRIVPTSDGDPLKEIHFHYNVPNVSGGVMCPKRNFGEPCAICEFATSVWKEAVENDDNEGKGLAKSLFVRSRYFSPVVVRGKESDGIKVYGYGKQAYESLLGYLLDPEYGDITDIKTGTDIGLVYTKPTKKGAFPTTNLKVRRKTSPLLADKDAIPALLKTMPNFDELFERKSSADVEDILSKMLDSKDSETTKYSNDDSSDVEDAFKELAGK